MKVEPWKKPTVQRWCHLLLASYRKWKGRDLIAHSKNLEETTKALFHAPFVVMSHGIEADPVLNFGNQQALKLWEMTWEHFTASPSRLTTESVNWSERARSLAEANEKGFLDNYRGVRITNSGKRFMVEYAIIWNVLDRDGKKLGQAATFTNWTMLNAVALSSRRSR